MNSKGSTGSFWPTNVCEGINYIHVLSFHHNSRHRSRRTLSKDLHRVGYLVDLDFGTHPLCFAVILAERLEMVESNLHSTLCAVRAVF